MRTDELSLDLDGTVARMDPAKAGRNAGTPSRISLSLHPGYKPALRHAQIGAPHLRIVEQLRSAARLGDAALVQHVAAVAQLQRREGILLHHHHGHALGADRPD